MRNYPKKFEIICKSIKHVQPDRYRGPFRPSWEKLDKIWHLKNQTKNSKDDSATDIATKIMPTDSEKQEMDNFFKTNYCKNCHPFFKHNRNKLVYMILLQLYPVALRCTCVNQHKKKKGPGETGKRGGLVQESKDQATEEFPSLSELDPSPQSFSKKQYDDLNQTYKNLLAKFSKLSQDCKSLEQSNSKVIDSITKTKQKLNDVNMEREKSESQNNVEIQTLK